MISADATLISASECYVGQNCIYKALFLATLPFVFLFFALFLAELKRLLEAKK